MSGDSPGEKAAHLPLIGSPAPDGRAPIQALETSLEAFFRENSDQTEAQVGDLCTRLVRIFAARGFGSAAEDMAQELLLRVLAKARSGDVTLTVPVDVYALGFVEKLQQEGWRKQKKTREHEVAVEAWDEIPDGSASPTGRYATAHQACAEGCFWELSRAERWLLRAYFGGSAPGDRKRIRNKLLKALCTTAVGLRVRVHKAKKKLRECMDRCMERSARSASGSS